MQVAHRLGHGGVHGRRVQNTIRAGGIAPRLLLRPAVARSDQSQLEQPPIAHGSGAGTDIIRELRPNQDDDRRVPGRTQIGATVSPGHVEKEFNLTCRSPRRAIYPAAPMAIEQCHRDMLLAGSGDCACSVTIVLIIAIIP